MQDSRSDFPLCFGAQSRQLVYINFPISRQSCGLRTWRTWGMCPAPAPRDLWTAKTTWRFSMRSWWKHCATRRHALSYVRSLASRSGIGGSCWGSCGNSRIWAVRISQSLVIRTERYPSGERKSPRSRKDFHSRRGAREPPRVSKLEHRRDSRLVTVLGLGMRR
jgi:hypothetical protein